MKCITIHQPWASLVVGGHKKHETRTWKTAHRGRILIHSGKRFIDAARSLASVTPFYQLLQEMEIKNSYDLPLGAIIGEVEILDCKDTEEIRDTTEELERTLGDFRNGRWAWILGSPKRYSNPIPYTGKQGLFEVPDEVVAPISLDESAQMAKAA